MYPLYWTPSKEGILMRYSYEYKKECVELYRQSKWAETPKGEAARLKRRTLNTVDIGAHGADMADLDHDGIPDSLE